MIFNMNSMGGGSYPVGSVYISVNSTSPASLFGGSWERIKDTFLLSAGDVYSAGSTGGEAQHTLTVNEMPSHLHTFGRDPGSGDRQDTGYTASGSHEFDSNSETSSVGGSQPHNNMPPYLAVYMWKRIA